MGEGYLELVVFRVVLICFVGGGRVIFVFDRFWVGGVGVFFGILRGELGFGFSFFGSFRLKFIFVVFRVEFFFREIGFWFVWLWR